MKNSWILFVAGRYLRVKRKTSGIGSAMLAVLGLSVGVMALFTVLSVMNGFQLDFIEDILEISSFHVRISDKHETEMDLGLVEELRNFDEVNAVLPFRDLQTLGRGSKGDFVPCLIRALPPDTRELDPGFARQLNVVQGSFSLAARNSIVVGLEMAYQLGVRVGDTMSLVSMAGDSFALLSPETRDFVITGIFHSGYYEFDSGLALVSLEGSSELSDTQTLVYGVKLKDRYNDRSFLKKLAGQDWMTDRQTVSWREFNKAFFGALRMEKNAMMILVGLIFLVVGVNIYHSQKRNVLERQEEIGIFRTMGTSPEKTRMIFLLEGALIGFLGASLGAVFGLLLTQNIQGIFSIAEFLANAGINLFNRLMIIMGNPQGLLPPVVQAFYFLPEIPVRIVVRELILIYLFAFLSSIAAAYFASRRVTEINPSQVLRYE